MVSTLSSQAENKMAAGKFHRQFLLLVGLAWTVPAAIGFSFFPVFEIFTVAQVVEIMLTPLILFFVSSVFILVLIYFHFYIRPVSAWIKRPAANNEAKVQRRLARFSLHFWCVFLLYDVLGATVTVVSAELYTDYSVPMVDVFRIYMVALIASIITGLPVFFKLFDLLGRSLGGLIRLSRPLLTIKMRVFLIGALIPLLIDTILIQYYWTRTGYFGWDTFAVWIMLELLAIAGTLLFLRGFDQSLDPLQGLLVNDSLKADDKEAVALKSASMDELGILSDRLADLLRERQLHNELLRRSQKMEALGKLTGGVAHDYNNLLGIISGFSEQLSLQLENQPGLQKYAQNIYRAAERGARLTKKLLVFSQYKSTDAEVVDLNSVLQENRLMLEKSITSRVDLTLDLTHDLWWVYLDRDDLEDAIINMCVNAKHAMEEGGQLTIQTRNEHIDERDARVLGVAAGDYILLNVIDTGCGMDKSTCEKVFDPFFTTKGGSGTGLGLSQVYGFVKRSDSFIKIYSEPGHGTRLSLYFPRTHKAPNLKQAKKLLASNMPDSKLKGVETVLVVDDENEMLELAGDILGGQGYRILTAVDGKKALEVLSTEAVDLVLTDVIMPNLDGYQLAKKIRDAYPHVKILITSGFTDRRHAVETGDAIYRNLLHKPFRSRELLERVRLLLSDAEDESKSSSESLAQRKRRILVVDDEEDILELFRLNLSKLGYDVELAERADKAIELYQKAMLSGHVIDAVIIDLSLPGEIEGDEIKNKIRQIDSQAKIIVCSGNSIAPEMEKYLAYGFDASLEKNFDRENMKIVLDSVLAH